MTDKRSRRGAVEMGTVLMIAAFAVIAGFIYWLSGQAAAERELEVVEDTTSAMVDDPYANATQVSAADIMLDASPYVGELIRLQPQTVLSLVGKQGFFLDFPSSPFFVSYTDQQIANEFAVAVGDVVRVVGRVTAMTDEVAAGWQGAGTISEGEAFVVTVNSYYLAAEDIEVSRPAPAGNAPAGNGA